MTEYFYLYGVDGDKLYFPSFFIMKLHECFIKGL